LLIETKTVLDSPEEEHKDREQDVGGGRERAREEELEEG
jgi:hypothetical protein